MSLSPTQVEELRQRAQKELAFGAASAVFVSARSLITLLEAYEDFGVLEGRIEDLERELEDAKEIAREAAEDRDDAIRELTLITDRVEYDT